MKLYTEEQVRRAIELARDEFTNDLDTSAIIRIIYSIELPSDEEIENNCDKIYDVQPKNDRYMTDSEYTEYLRGQSFIEGAKWMKEQITKQD